MTRRNPLSNVCSICINIEQSRGCETIALRQEVNYLRLHTSNLYKFTCLSTWNGRHQGFQLHQISLSKLHTSPKEWVVPAVEN
ncbi:hypothetical protein DAI22_04g092950 [Oryza sativa Japonica Group]|nr:hypothetical protein DAI22_04g092950 [Oryza sativa Japonica Group]